ncbi:MAG: V-type ATP synthase subunit A [Clostridia bacterium]
MQKKYIISINGPVIKAKGDGDFAMHDIVHISDEKILGEVIKLTGDIATIQVYEGTTGLKIGQDVIGEEEPLTLVLGPGIISNIFDGIERPLKSLRDEYGDFIKRGASNIGVDTEKKWHFVPKVQVGDIVTLNSIIGEVKETELITNKIMNKFDCKAKIIEIANEGDYTVLQTIAKIETIEEGQILELNMIQKWPVRKPRPYKNRLTISTPLITGQRVIDTLFPIAKGGTAMIPGGFGTGKTVTQHQLAKWSNADIIVYIGCGERGNEMTEVLEDFPKLKDPKSGRPLMDRTVLIANTSNMPVAARETSIYTGITIAEYYRDMGYDVAIMADSTSRWAEALREISGRLEEMPAEEGFPSYLPSRLSEFYGRAGMVETLNGNTGSVTIIGAVSPQGSDFSEPVTQNTKRFVHVFWGLNRTLAYSRHYPAIDWNISYSEYIDNLSDWYDDNVDSEFLEYRTKIVKILEKENELLEIARVVGQDVLSDDKKLLLEVASSIRIGFLQQNSFNDIDTSVTIEKQFKMMETIILIYDRALKLINKGIPISEIKKTGLLEEYNELKYNVKNDEIEKIDEFDVRIKNRLKKLEDEYREHI